MHTVETETVEHGKARVHYNADFSGSVLISWRGGTAEIPGEVFGALALMVVFEEIAKSFLRRWSK